MSMKLRELIRAVRAAKTAAEERAVITKESALIRSAFKSDTSSTSMLRHRNVAKLLFIHMLGYPSHFGQMETLKLISSPVFAEKRMGYLALGILLDENQEILMLVTNCMKNDLRHPNQYVCGLALTALGNISSTEMTRDLASEIDTHLRNTNPYIRKKAALCAHRIMVKVPDLVEDFIDRATGLLSDRNHGVLYTGIQLIIYIMTELPDYRSHFTRSSVVKKLVKRLTSLVRSGFQPDYDVSGCTDPFLQVSFLRLLRLIGQGNQPLSEMMTDVLAQVATNTETSKSVGHAILYECVLTIMKIEADVGLRVLGINLLGRFMKNTDNNTRFVGLKTLSMVVHRSKVDVRRHRDTIIDCLKDPDVTIRKRAMELIFDLVDEENIRTLAREMLNYLVTSKNDENRPALCLRISDVVEEFAPNPQWHLETLITMMSIGGESITQDTVARVVRIITREPSLQAYVTHKLFRMLSEDLSQVPLTEVGLWTIGEYGQFLASGCQDHGATFDAVAEADILALVNKALHIYFATDTMKGMALTALTKLAPKMPAQHQHIEKIVSSFKRSVATDLQQRSVEYSELLSEQWDSVRSAVQAPVPPMPDVVRPRRASADGGADGEGGGSPGAGGGGSARGGAGNGSSKSRGGGGGAPPASPEDDILGVLGGGGGGGSGGGSGNGSAVGGLDDDLLAGLFGGGGSSAPVAAAPSLPGAVRSMGGGGGDRSGGFGVGGGGGGGGGGNVLDDIFGGGGTMGASPAPAPVPVPSVGGGGGGMGGGMDDIFGGLGASPARAPAPAVAMGGGSMGGMVMDDPMMFGGSSPVPALAAAGAGGERPLVVFNEEGLTTTFAFSKPEGPNSPVTVVQLTTTNQNAVPVTGFDLAGATPKYVLCGC
jgi:AP-1 complex subunit gamma-1